MSQVDDVRADQRHIGGIDEDDLDGGHPRLEERDATLRLLTEHGVAAEHAGAGGDAVALLVVDGLHADLMGGAVSHRRGAPVGVRDVGAGGFELPIELGIIALVVGAAESQEDHETEGGENTHGSDPGAG